MRASLFAAAAVAVFAVAFAVEAAGTIPANVAAAVANPEQDLPRTPTADAARKPAEVLAFAKVKSGEQVLELIPGGGYFTRLLSRPSARPAMSPSAGAADRRLRRHERQRLRTASPRTRIFPTSAKWRSRRTCLAEDRPRPVRP